MGLGKYIDLSQLAKNIGGPEKCIKIIKSHNAIVGTTIALLPFAAYGAVDAGQKAYQKIKSSVSQKNPTKTKKKQEL